MHRRHLGDDHRSVPCPVRFRSTLAPGAPSPHMGSAWRRPTHPPCARLPCPGCPKTKCPPRSGHDGKPAPAYPRTHKERLNGEIKRHSDVVGILPNEAAVTRLIGMLLLEQNDEWSVQRARYMSFETIAPLSDDLAASLPPLAA